MWEINTNSQHNILSDGIRDHERKKDSTKIHDPGGVTAVEDIENYPRIARRLSCTGSNFNKDLIL